MVNGIYSAGDVVLGNWTLTRLIGAGSYGRVFEAEREDFGTTYKAAIKIITIPQNQTEIKSARAEGMDDKSVTAYFRSFVEEIVSEIALMSRLKGTANVVGYEDHTVIQHTDGVGWDIIIRMELLTPLLDYTAERSYTRKDVIKLGIDMCNALELCQRFNIIHRDIKPENIFISDIGDYKLGDFGIARTVDKTTDGLSRKGTYTYMAPEIYRDGIYGSSVDIYSLGVVLYRLLNDNRAPFLPAYPAPITHSEREAALAKRISGAKLSVPKNADGRLSEIVLKSCAYEPKERYSSPMLLRQELEAILYSREEAPIIYPKGDETPVKSVEYAESVPRRPEPAVREKTALLIEYTDVMDAEESIPDTPVLNEISESDTSENLIAELPITENVTKLPNKNRTSVNPKNSKLRLFAAICIGIFMAANIVGFISLASYGVEWRYIILGNTTRIIESALILFFLFKKKPKYIIIPLIFNVIAAINYHGLIYLNYTYLWDKFTSTWPAIMSVAMPVAYWRAVKGAIKKNTASIIMIVCCAVLCVFDTEVLLWFSADYYFSDLLSVFGYILEQLIPVFHYAAYALIVLSLKPSDVEEKEEGKLDQTVTLSNRSKFLLMAAIVSCTLTVESLAYIFCFIFGWGFISYTVGAVFLAVSLLIGAYAVRRR